MKKLIWPIFFVLSLNLGFSQTTIVFEDFEDGTVTYSSNYSESSDNGADYWGRVNTSNTSHSWSSTRGSYWFGGCDMDAAPTPVTSDLGLLTWSSIDISSYNSFTFSFYVAEDQSSDGNEDWDADAYLKVYYNIDGGSTLQYLRSKQLEVLIQNLE